MTGLPALTGDEIVKALVKAGFQKIHQKGGHGFIIPASVGADDVATAAEKFQVPKAKFQTI